jgi:hypothetical protein
LSYLDATHTSNPLSHQSKVDAATGLVSGNLDNIWDNSKSSIALELFQEAYAPTKSMRLCNRAVIPSKNVSLRYNPATGKARFSGLMSCDNALCLHCYSRVRAKAVEQTATALSQAQSLGWAGLFLTLTLPKFAVEEQIEVLNKCFNNLTANIRAWCKRRGIEVGYTFGLDFTVNPSKAYNEQIHSHIHTPFVFSHLNAEHQEELGEKIKSWWCKSVERVSGKRPVRSAQDVRAIIDFDSAIGAYTMKMNALKTAQEAVNGATKSSAFGYGWVEFITLCASSYNEKLIAIYQRVIKAFKGKKFFRLNKVMKELADIDIEDDNVEEVEEVEVSMSSNLFVAVQELELKKLWLSVFADFHKNGNNKSKYDEIVALCRHSIVMGDKMSVDDWIDNIIHWTETNNNMCAVC